MTIGTGSVGPTRLIARMAGLLAADRAPHPLAGALSAAVRGRQQLDLAMFAAETGLEPAVVEAAEAGYVPFDRLPSPIASRISWLGVDLVALAADPAA